LKIGRLEPAIAEHEISDLTASDDFEARSLDKKDTTIFDDVPASHVKLQELRNSVSQLLKTVAQVVLGKRDVARLCIVALLAGEHVLLEDVPGVGKTLMGRALSSSVEGSFSRI